MNTLGQAIDALAQTIAGRVGADPEQSYTAALLAAGPARCAKKLGEEGVEAALALVGGDRAHFAAEAADVIFHLLVAAQVGAVAPADIAAALEARRGVSGHDEKVRR